MMGQLSIQERRDFKVFIIGWMILVLLLACTQRGDVFLWINQFSNSISDRIFTYITHTGLGIFAASIGLFFLLFISLKKGMQLSLALLLVSVFTNLGKRFLFFQHNRPLMEYDYIDLYRIVPDVPLSFYRSFPSGHTMTAFGLAVVLASFTRDDRLGILLYCWAMLVAFSRIYLCQHFFVDVVWGMILGFCAGILSLVIMNKISEIKNKEWLDKSVYGLLWKKYNASKL
jgi:membrane-associated phospholipid phosphatase